MKHLKFTFLLLSIISTFAFADWEKTISGQTTVIVDETGWMLSLAISGTNATITSILTAGDATIDLSKPVNGLGDGVQITGIAQKAFFNKNNFSTFITPPNLQSIGIQAFANVTSLTNLVLNENLKVISTSAFNGCSALKNITFKEGLETIGNSAFYKTTNLGDIVLPESLKSIENSAFNESGLKSVVFGKKSVEIGENAFYMATSLKRIFFKGDPPIFLPKGSAFRNNHANIDPADFTLTRCYFIPYGNEKWNNHIALFPFNNSDEILNFSNLFPDLNATPYGLVNWLSFREKSAYWSNISENFQYICRWLPDETGEQIFVDGSPAKIGSPTPSYGHIATLTGNQTVTLSAPAAYGTTNCLGYVLATIPKYGEPYGFVTNLGATSVTLTNTGSNGKVVKWLWDIKSPYIWLTKSDEKDSPSMTLIGGWSDNRAPHPDADYLISDGMTAYMARGLGSASSPYMPTSFNGASLTLGESNGNDGWLEYIDNAHRSQQIINNLTIVNGGIKRPVADGNANSIIIGTLKILTTLSNPAKFLGAFNNPVRVNLSGDIQGDDEACFGVANEEGVGNGISLILPEMKNYSGGFYASGENCWICFNSHYGFGAAAAPSKLVEKSIYLENNGGLFCSASKLVNIPATRGIYIGNGTGKIKFSLNAQIKGPISGHGKALFIGNVPGLNIPFSASFTAPCIAITNIAVSFTQTAAIGENVNLELHTGGTLKAPALIYNMLDTITISSNGVVNVSDDNPVTFNNAVLQSHATLNLNLNAEEATSNIYNFTENTKINGKIRVTTSVPFPLNNGPKEYKFMTLPNSVKRLTGHDFDTSSIVFDTDDGKDPNGIYIVKAVVKQGDDGSQNVYLKRGLPRNNTLLLLH